MSLAEVAPLRTADVQPDPRAVKVAVLVPCMNEEAAITSVVRNFRAALPGAEVYVYDNNSTDGTVEAARAAGAVVRAEPLQGKGNVVRRMFSDVEADVYVLVDGDDTYDAASSPAMIARLLDQQLDMVNGAREEQNQAAYRPGHRLGNAVLTGMVAAIFGNRFKDLLSGYRIFSRRFVKSFPALSTGFEIETELTVHALELRMPVAEVGTPYKDRPAGSTSKLKTYRDGVRILKTIVNLMKGERPLLFFSMAFAALALLSIVLVYPVFQTYRETGLVPRFPTAILSTGIMLLAFLCLFAGLILDTVTHGRRELNASATSRFPPPGDLLLGEMVGLGRLEGYRFSYILVSSDKGTTWRPASAALPVTPNEDLHGLAYSTQRKAFYVWHDSCSDIDVLNDAVMRFDYTLQ